MTRDQILATLTDIITAFDAECDRAETVVGVNIPFSCGTQVSVDIELLRSIKQLLDPAPVDEFEALASAVQSDIDRIRHYPYTIETKMSVLRGMLLCMGGFEYHK